MFSIAVLLPPAAGAKRTEIVCVPFEASVSGKEGAPTSEYSAACVPVKLIPDKVSAPAPVFWITKVLVVLLPV